MHIVPSQSFMENVLLSDLHLWPMFVNSALRTLGYTALMGAPPKVQPMFVSYTLRITRLHCMCASNAPRGAAFPDDTKNSCAAGYV